MCRAAAVTLPHHPPPVGVTYPLDAGKGGYVMHGGGINFSRREWEVVAAEPQSVSLALDSPTGDQGFPGNLSVLVNYTLTDENELIIGAAGGSAARPWDPCSLAPVNAPRPGATH